MNFTMEIYFLMGRIKQDENLLLGLSDNNSPKNIAKNTKTGNYNDDIKAYIGRYVSFWSHQALANLLLNYNPVFSNTLMLQISLYIIAVIASEEPVKLFPDMY